MSVVHPIVECGNSTVADRGVREHAVIADLRKGSVETVVKHEVSRIRTRQRRMLVETTCVDAAAAGNSSTAAELQEGEPAMLRAILNSRTECSHVSAREMRRQPKPKAKEQM